MTTDCLARELFEVWAGAIERLPGPLCEDGRSQLTAALGELENQAAGNQAATEKHEARARRWLSLACGGWVRLVKQWPMTPQTREHCQARICAMLDER